MKKTLSYFKSHFIEISSYLVFTGLAFGYRFHITIFETPVFFILLLFALIGIVTTIAKILGINEHSHYEENSEDIYKVNSSHYTLTNKGSMNELNPHIKEKEMNE